MAREKKQTGEVGAMCRKDCAKHQKSGKTQEKAQEKRVRTKKRTNRPAKRAHAPR